MATQLKMLKVSDHPNAVDFEVTTCFIECQGKYLVLQRGRKDEQFGLWGIPGGKLEENESPTTALSREIFEETSIIIPESSYTFLSKAHSINPFDGSYILYLYKASLKTKPLVLIDTKEHTACKWVTLNEFENLDLLVSQGPAFELVRNKLD